MHACIELASISLLVFLANNVATEELHFFNQRFDHLIRQDMNLKSQRPTSFRKTTSSRDRVGFDEESPRSVTILCNSPVWYTNKLLDWMFVAYVIPGLLIFREKSGTSFLMI